MYTKSFNTKKTWLGAVFTFALVAIMGLTFAFKPFENPKAVEQEKLAQWFTWQPVGSSTDRSDPDNYQPGDPGCDPGTNLCAVMAETIENIDDPSLQSEINDALTNPGSYTGTRVKLKQ